MILRALYELADREGLVSDPDFQPVGVSWIVRVSADGRITGIDDTRRVVSPPGKAIKHAPQPIRVPLQKGRTGIKPPPYFLVDNAKYVFGQRTDEKDFNAVEQEKYVERAKSFRLALQRCAEVTSDSAVSALLSALIRWSEGERNVSLPADCRSNDLFAFVFAPDVDTFIHDRPAVVTYWRSLRAGERAATTNNESQVRCIITGAPVDEPSLFPKVKIRGGQGAGALLVSFNAGAFESYGFARSANAPMLRPAAEAAGTALQRLVSPAFPDPNNPATALPRRNLLVGDDTVVCYWSAKPSPLPDILGAMFDTADPQSVAEQYRSMWHGRPAPDLADGEFYVLTVSGAQGRIVVRDWLPTTVSRVNANLARYFADLALARNTPTPKERALLEYLPLSALMRSLSPFGRQDGIPQALTTAMVRAAVDGTPYPVSVLTRALERERAESMREDWSDLERRDARAMLIKAVLSRTFHHQLTPTMDPENRNPGYLCGRLLAVLERLQNLALGDVNAGVVDRYFGAASATPRTVFVRLLRNAKHHERKAMDDPKKTGFTIMLKRMIDEIVAGIDPGMTAFPAYLPLEEQGLFMLGYHHQRHALFAKRGSADDSSPDVGNTAA